jgi:excisionase family DNA binding protein
MTTPRTLSVRQAANQLGCTLKYIYDLLYSGRLGGEKVGRKWRIPAEALRTKMQRRADGD